jgi:CheY-like chemotaxis protein
MKKILVVDDDEMLCRFACDILSMEGYRAVPAVSIGEALEAFEHEQFDLLVTNSHMPGMSGVELAQAVRGKIPGFPVIVMTAYEPVECEHVKLWLPKRYLFPSLVEKIHLCLSEIDASLEKSIVTK